MTQRQATTQQQQQQCTEHATTAWLPRHNATTPSSSRQHHARVADPRRTVSSCFGRNLRSVAHHTYQVPGISLLLATASFVTTQIQHTTTAAAVHRSCYNQLATTLHPCRAQQQQTTACGAYALYSVELFRKEPEIRHPSHLRVSLC
ncbi:unnamed protein product [Laminaria digitata]